MGTKRVLLTVFITLFLALFFVVSLHPVKAEEATPVEPSLIGPVFTGFQSAGNEFFELYNPYDTQLELTGWTVVYENASGSVRRDIARLEGQLVSGEYLLFASQAFAPELAVLVTPQLVTPFLSSSGLLDSGGKLQLVYNDPDDITAEAAVYETVSWGSVPGGLTIPTLASAKRCLLADATLALSGDQLLDFVYVSTPPFATFGPYCVVLPDEEEDTDDDEAIEQPDPTTTLTCEGLILNELLPNAAGSDIGREFIELYNPTQDFIDVLGCMLQTSSSSKLYSFTASQIIAPGSYLLLSDTITGLTLPNGAGGTVWLIAASGIEIAAATYPAAIEDDSVWVYVDGTWQLSYAATPGGVNILVSLKPCSSGYIRNGLTGRCVLVAATSSASTILADCGSGRERNPETNRCRAVLAATTTLVPCAADEYRNPETNRCRKLETATALAPCDPGQERNPETNRCRAAAVVGEDIAAVTDVRAGERADMTGWIVAGSVLLVAIMYGLFEWRKDIGRWLRSILPVRRG